MFFCSTLLRPMIPETGYCKNRRKKSPCPEDKKRKLAGRWKQYFTRIFSDVFRPFSLLSVRRQMEIAGKEFENFQTGALLSWNPQHRPFSYRILRLGYIRLVILLIILETSIDFLLLNFVTYFSCSITDRDLMTASPFLVPNMIVWLFHI